MSQNAIALIIGAINSRPAAYLSTVGFASNGTGSALASVYFEGRIDSETPITSETSVSCIFWGARSGFSLSEIVLLNDDGALDYLLFEPAVGRTIEIKTGQTDQIWEDWITEFTGTVEDIDFSEANRPKLRFANAAAIFDKPYQPLTYSGVNSAVDGKPKPLSFGLPLNVQPVLTNPTLLEFDCGPDTTALLVRDNGVELTPTTQWTQSAGVVTILTLNQPVVGKITADLDGDAGAEITEFCEQILTQAGKSPSDLGAIDLSSLAYTYGFWSQTPITCAQVLNLLMDSHAGWWWMDNLGKLRLGQIKEPSSPVLAIGPEDFAQDAQIPGGRKDRMPGFSKICAAQKNYFVHNPSEIGNVLTDPVYTQIAIDLQADYRIRKTGVTTGTPPADQLAETNEFDGAQVTTNSTGIGTLLVDATDAQTEADRWLALRDKRRAFYDVTVILELEDIRALDIGDTVKVTGPVATLAPGGRRLGLDSKNLLVIGIRKAINSNTVTLNLWGDAFAGDAPDPPPIDSIFICNFTGADNSTTFIDEAEGNTITPHGDVTIQTSGGQHGLFDGSGDYLSVARGAGWALGAEFTIEAFVSFDSAGFMTIASQFDNGGGNRAWSFYILSGFLYFSYSIDGSTFYNIPVAFTPTPGQQYHIVAEHDGDKFRMYIDGITVFGYVDPLNIFAGSTQDLFIGRANGYSADLAGKIFGIRISEFARYAVDGFYTIPTLPF